MIGELDKQLKRIQALIAKADGTDYPAEADSFRAKAEALMHQYRIEESMLAAAAPVGTGLAPVWAEWIVCEMHNEFYTSYHAIASYVLHHVGGEGVLRYKAGNAVMECVGYESDLRYGEMLLTSATLAFGRLLEPTYNANESDQLNAYRMRKAGMEGRRIAMALWGRDDKHLRPKARKLYEAEARSRGEDPKELMGQGNSVKVYRQSYAEGFTAELWHRLVRMRYTKGEESQGLVLAGRRDAVQEAFYERYPQFRPQPRAGRIGECPQCAKAKSGHCRKHPAPRIGPAKSYNHRAATRGAEAAATVDLGATGRLTS